MVELIRGLKAGVVAGFIWGIFSALLMLIFFPVFASLLGIQTSPPPLGGSYVKLRVNPFIGLIIGPIFGAILGIIYAFTYNGLPDKKLGRWTVSMTKGSFLALLVWVILFLITVPTRLSTTLFFSEFEDYRILQIIMTAFALWFFIVFLGQQLGYFWDRFKPK